MGTLLYYLSREQPRCWSPVRMRRLLCTFVVRTWHKRHFPLTWLIWWYWGNSNEYMFFVEKYGRLSQNCQIPTLSVLLTLLKWWFQGIVRLSNLAAPIMLLTGHEGEIFTTKFSPDGKMLASAGFDRLICKFSEYHISLVMRKRVFGSFRPGQTQTGLLSYRS